MSNSIFCDDCGSLLAPNGAGHTKKCRFYLGRVIPSSVNAYATVGMLGYYKYTVSAPEDLRRKRLLRLYGDELMHSGENADYVNSFGPPRSDRRVSRISEIMDGLNEFTGGASRRNADYHWLWNIHNKEK